jgi:hypothetical protein
MMTDCRWWLSLLSNSRNMNCHDWDDCYWADAAAAGDAIWQPFSGFADAVRRIGLSRRESRPDGIRGGTARFDTPLR